MKDARTGKERGGWGGWNFLVRFDCDLHRDRPERWPGGRCRFHGTIREVLDDPKRFGLPSE